ncbi:hypothetical protein AiwAL_09830 [Acidiphilium sp. AL]|uniref:Uncharacterized protein n=1 Tax=Acidiphilium iwatense TaxID=768198 RepID=A0ABS9DUT1_9PROT|nr:hypothetical protein [Acidiphilium sp. AL]MCF3946506.1 hypothetical protein [Acidiphilium iwatense]MCU4160407.1 hypothetical protein [Acidiphilium sp. AL]
MIFILLIYYEKNYSKSVIAENILESSIVSWIAVSFSTLLRLAKSNNAMNGKFILILVRKISRPFSILLFIELMLFFLMKERKEFMIVFICSVAATTTIYLALASLWEFSIWLNRPRNRR